MSYHQPSTWATNFNCHHPACVLTAGHDTDHINRFGDYYQGMNYQGRNTNMTNHKAVPRWIHEDIPSTYSILDLSSDRWGVVLPGPSVYARDLAAKRDLVKEFHDHTKVLLINTLDATHDPIVLETTVHSLRDNLDRYAPRTVSVEILEDDARSMLERLDQSWSRSPEFRRFADAVRTALP